MSGTSGERRADEFGQKQAACGGRGLTGLRERRGQSAARALSDPSLDLHATCVRALPTSVEFGCNNVRAEPSIRHVVTLLVDCALHALVWTPQAYAQLSRFCAGIPHGRHLLEESEGKSVPIQNLKPGARVVFSSQLQIFAAFCSSVLSPLVDQ